MITKSKILILLLLSSFLSNCSNNCVNSYDKKYKGSVKVGSDYKVKNVTYSPKVDPNYDQIGLASWYGHHFHCKKTANGETFNKNQFSAAHKTLPLPSVVKVTNLSNGKTVEVVINDRGPFVKGRIIDLSENAAHAIGMKHHGVAQVRVQFLPEETNKLMQRINAKNKIFYDGKPNSKYNIFVANYSDQKTALTTLRKLSKLGKSIIVSNNNKFKVLLTTNNQIQAKEILNKLTKLGYKNAKIIHN